ncbi:hypothetical protein F4806DRAFT_244896 [Annulohypoxylon nitens]|nr:hypothetical protein F4806DRAFT_244896 [Annulohypoxylon nitens]
MFPDFDGDEWARGAALLFGTTALDEGTSEPATPRSGGSDTTTYDVDLPISVITESPRHQLSTHNLELFERFIRNLRSSTPSPILSTSSATQHSSSSGQVSIFEVSIGRVDVPLGCEACLSGTTQLDGQLLTCVLHKRDPKEHLECGSEEFKTINHLRQHLDYEHKSKEHSCQSCLGGKARGIKPDIERYWIWRYLFRETGPELQYSYFFFWLVNWSFPEYVRASRVIVLRDFGGKKIDVPGVPEVYRLFK